MSSRPHAVAPVTETDRRAEPRTECSVPAQLLRYPPGRRPMPLDVTLMDYSASGVGVIYGEDLLIGQTFILREPTVTAGRTCLYRVVHSEKLEDARFRIGLQALKMLEDEWAPFEPPPAPGVDLGTKLLYLTFAIAGAATIIATAILFHQH